MNRVAHIGMPKAGSTSMQRHLFPYLQNFCYIGRSPKMNVGNDLTIEKGEIDNDIEETFHTHLVGEEVFDSDQTKKALDKLTKSCDSRNILYSSEFLTSVFFCYPKIEEKLERLQALGFNKIVLIVRRQPEIIKSQYQDHPFEPSDLVHGKPVSIDEWIRKAYEMKEGYLASLNYHNLIKKLIELFGKENVHIDLLENISGDFETFANNLLTFLNISSEKLPITQLPQDNSGVSKRYNTIRRLKKQLIGELPISKVIPKRVQSVLKGRLKKGPKETLNLSESSRDLLRRMYLDGNIELIKSGLVDLKKHRYDQI